MLRPEPAFAAVVSTVVLVFSYLWALETQQSLSPQGCRMSWMSQSYILQTEFDNSWSPLARRYSLWLYREAGWESTSIHGGMPVLFIPGNAGSSRQVRSIASSAARQFFSSPYKLDETLQSRGVKPLDLFTVEFNEDLSAFHGPTIEAQTRYTAAAVDYILSKYPADTSIIIMGHSMGGIVATSLLPSSKISAVFTMSTPHRVPPARFDHRIDEIYDHNLKVLREDPTPIVSLCGGATDLQIPSESCILPSADNDTQQDSVVRAPFRRTVFSSALEGAWTGVGHREMVWCHQVRWRVAKAALELAPASSSVDKGVVLDRWLRDGHALPHETVHDHTFDAVLDLNYEFLDEGKSLSAHAPPEPKTYFLPLRSAQTRFLLFASEANILSVSPYHSAGLNISLYLCRGSYRTSSQLHCRSLEPTTHKLIPNADEGKPFPVPNEGIDESEGVVLFEASVPAAGPGADDFHYVAVHIESTEGHGWIEADFVEQGEVVNKIKTSHLLFGRSSTLIPRKQLLSTRISFPNILANALLVYRITPHLNDGDCPEMLLWPLLSYTSAADETHYFPLTEQAPRQFLLHSHRSAPHVRNTGSNRGLALNLYSVGAGTCPHHLSGMDIQLDWKATIGRWATRYFTAAATWAIGVVGIMLFDAWGEQEAAGRMPSVHETLTKFCRSRLLVLAIALFLASFAPLSENYFLGNQGEPYLAFISPLVVIVAGGLVCTSWFFLTLLMVPLGKIATLFSARRAPEITNGMRRSTLISMGLIFVLVFLFIPWQVAYLTCWLMQLYNCALSMARRSMFGSSQKEPPSKGVELLQTPTTDDGDSDADSTPNPGPSRRYAADNYNHSMHLLLLMTWLLPLSAPVLVVWVRTLATAGLTTPWDGDHLFLNVAPFLIIVDFASWIRGPLFEKQRFEKWVSLRWSFAIVSFSAFSLGSRKAYFVFDIAKVFMGIITVARIGPRYLGKAAWAPS